MLLVAIEACFKGGIAKEYTGIPVDRISQPKLRGNMNFVCGPRTIATSSVPKYSLLSVCWLLLITLTVLLVGTSSSEGC